MFQGLEKRWHKPILSGGDYFKRNEINVEELIRIFHFTNKFLLFAHSGKCPNKSLKFRKQYMQM